MDNDKAMAKMIDSLEINGEIRFFNTDMDIYIQSIDSKEGFSYITRDGIEFDSSQEAVEWAVCMFGGIESIGRWE